MPKKIPFVNEALSQARSLEKRGDIAQAENIYRTILQRYPTNKLAKKRLKAVQKTGVGKGQKASVGMPSQVEIKGLVSLFNQGRLSEALTQGSALSVRYPGAPSIHNILGVINARMGRTETALDCYNRALAIKPDYAEVLSNRGNALNRLGRHTEAIASFRKALQINPAYAEAHNNMGNALHDAGKLDEAVASYREALKIKPGYADAQNNLGSALADRGQADAALASFNAALGINPDFAQALYNSGNTLRSLGRFDEAVTRLGRAVQLKPDYAEAFNSLGNIYNEQGRHQLAVDSLSRAIQLIPGYSQAHSNLGNVLSDLGRPDDAVSSYRTALQINPGFAEGHCNLGNTLNDLGRYEEAIASYNQALQLKPDFAEVHNNLSQIKTYHRDDPQVAWMQEQLDDPNVTENEAMHLGFALGKACDDLGNVDQAFEHFREGNRLKKKALAYDISQDRARFELIKSLFTAFKPPVSQDTEAGHGFTKQPIFIVGLPRSGTSLVEQILASHSRVFGAGELEVLGRTLNPLMTEMASDGQSQFNTDMLASLRSTYLQALDQLPCTEPYITDKMPGNFKWTGFLLAAMPAVKIIHVQRDPAATCWSMFRNYFGGGGHGYAYDLVDVAEYYNLYKDLMKFWQETFPDRIYDLSYELLTENQDGESHRLLKYCGIDWEDHCLAFHKTRRSVRTLSSQQVRQKMYTGSSQAWRKYEAHLQPMLSLLPG